MSNHLFAYSQKRPALFGKYWLQVFPNIENEKEICLHYSLAKGAALGAAEVKDGHLNLPY